MENRRWIHMLIKCMFGWPIQFRDNVYSGFIFCAIGEYVVMWKYRTILKRWFRNCTQMRQDWWLSREWTSDGRPFKSSMLIWTFLFPMPVWGFSMCCPLLSQTEACRGVKSLRLWDALQQKGVPFPRFSSPPHCTEGQSLDQFLLSGRFPPHRLCLWAWGVWDFESSLSCPACCYKTPTTFKLLPEARVVTLICMI